MSKLDEVKRILRNPMYAEFMNASISEFAKCDEALVRRARREVQVDILTERIAELEKTLASCDCEQRRRAAECRAARKQRAKDDNTIRPLWESDFHGKPLPKVRMIGED